MYSIPTESDSLRWLLVPLVIFGRYFALCAVSFLLFYVWKRRAWLARKIQHRFPAGSDYRRELGYSALTALIFGAAAWLCLGTPLRAYTRFYTDVNEYGRLYLALSIPLAVVIHDAYFYWIHRLMHHPRLYPLAHRLHHKSVNPSPWAAYAFHPAEAVLEAGILPLLLFVMPLHPLSLLGFISVMLWFNVYGHLGYELFPAGVYRHPVGRWLNSAIYHNQHHERFHGNYGLYFAFWDRVMGTLRADSAAKVDAVHERIGERKNQLTGLPGASEARSAVVSK
jgi:lathosterol oxidase